MWWSHIAKIIKLWYSRSHIVNKIADWLAKKISKKNPGCHDSGSPDVSLVDVLLVLSGSFSRRFLSGRSHRKSRSVAYVGVEAGGLSLFNCSGSYT